MHESSSASLVKGTVSPLYLSGKIEIGIILLCRMDSNQFNGQVTEENLNRFTN